MSHAIDFDGLQEKLFLLRHLSLGSINYCKEENVGSNIDIGEGEFDSYWGLLKVLLSNYLIESAVKLRMIQEFCTKNGYDEELSNIEKNAIEGLNLGSILEGSFKLTIRESTNKIIHATMATIEFSESNGIKHAFKHWDGYYHLHGNKGKASWHLALNVNSWAKAISAYLEELESNELTIYMGQDWA
jgi:hypothetical protein